MYTRNKFFLWLFITEAIYLLFYLVSSWSYFLGIQDLRLKDNRYFVIVMVLLGLLIFLYRKTYDSLTGKISFKKLFIFFVILNLSLLFVNNITSDDLNTYIFRGRIISYYEANPYIVRYDDFPNDAFLSLKTVWSSRRAIYGPIIMSGTGILSKIAGDSIALNLFAFKSFFVLLNIICGVFVYKITKSLKAFFLYAWNPLLVFETAVNGHIDIAMALPVVIALFFLIRKKGWFSYSLVFVFLTVSVLIKYLTGIFSIFFLVFVIRKLPENRDRVKFIFFSVLSSITILFFSLLPFWVGTRTFGRLFDQSVAELFGASLLVGFFDKVLNLINEGNNFKSALFMGRIVFGIVFTYLLFKSVVLRKFKVENLLAFLFYLFFVLLFTALPLVQTWYLITPITIACIWFAFNPKMGPRFIYFATILGFLNYFILR